MARSQQVVAPPVGADTGFENSKWGSGGTTTAVPVRLPAGLVIPPPTGDALQDAYNLQAKLIDAVNNPDIDPGERQAAFNAYQSVSDDAARLLKERLAWNTEQDKLSNPPPPKPADIASAGPTDKYILTRMSDGSLKQEPNPNYTPPAAPQGPAFSGTAAGMLYASQQRLEELRVASDLRRQEGVGNEAERIFKDKQKMIDLGYEMTPKDTLIFKAQLDGIMAKFNREDAEYTRALAAAERAPYDQMAMLRGQQSDLQVARAERLQGAQTQATQYGAQAEQGLGLLNRATAQGVRISPQEYTSLYFDPHKRAIDILAEAMARGPEFDANKKAIDVLSQQIMSRPVQTPVAPTAPDFSSLMGPRAPMPVQ